MNRLVLRAAILAGGVLLAGAAHADEPVRCTTDALNAETCRYADGTTTRRSTDAMGVETFRDRDGTVSRQKVDPSAIGVVTNGRGRIQERCYDDGQGHAVCQRGRPR
jgi:hypothetical protein